MPIGDETCSSLVVNSNVMNGDIVKGSDENAKGVNSDLAVADIIPARCGSTKRKARCRAFPSPCQWTSSGRTTIITATTAMRICQMTLRLGCPLQCKSGMQFVMDCIRIGDLYKWASSAVE